MLGWVAFLLKFVYATYPVGFETLHAFEICSNLHVIAINILINKAVSCNFEIKTKMNDW